jgi:isopentenyl-diphosphate delta-isomerase
VEDRKKDHINLAFKSRITSSELDRRFYYEPLLSKHPSHELPVKHLFGKQMRAPIWVSSMTGGTRLAGTINTNLAKVCQEFGLGMGLGSCRPLLQGDEYLSDFDVRDIIGDEVPFYANLGIFQVEEMVLKGNVTPIEELVQRLRADGLIIHVNPLQEWLQPEGDRFSQSPIDTIRSFIEMTSLRIIVKEVGQGMGPGSLKALLDLPIEGIEFGAFGGTNFARVELMRSAESKQQFYEPISKIGHDAFEMTEMVNSIVEESHPAIKAKSLIISGGIPSFLDGHYLVTKSALPAVYGQASEFLRYASKSYEELREFVTYQVEGLKVASAYFRTKDQKG